MSIEEQLAELNKNLSRNNELLELQIEGREKLVEKAEKLAGSKSKTEKTEKAAAKADKPKKAEKSGKDDVSDKGIRTRFGDFMAVEDKKDREKRKAFVEALIAHFDVEQLLDMDDEDRKEALGYLKQAEDGDTFKLGKVEYEGYALADDEDDEDEDEEDERPAKKSKKSKSKSRDDDDEDEDDEDEEDEEDEDEEDERPRKKGKKR